MIGGLELWSRHSEGTGAGLEKLADLLTLAVTERNSRPDDVALLLLHRLAGPDADPGASRAFSPTD